MHQPLQAQALCSMYVSDGAVCFEEPTAVDM